MASIVSRTSQWFACEGRRLAATLDSGTKPSGLMIVSGGNEIRAGAHAGMALLAKTIASHGFPVFRYDRRGIGDSEGDNAGYLESAPDLRDALAHFRSVAPELENIALFGNCDAATAIALFDQAADARILANPWVIELQQDSPQDGPENDPQDGAQDNATQDSALPSSAAVRARYWERIKNPKTITDLLTGKIDFQKLAKGLRRAVQKTENSPIATQFRDALQKCDRPTTILLARRDNTAMTFQAAWNSPDFKSLKNSGNIDLQTIDSASHSFADAESSQWMKDQLLRILHAL